MESWLHMVIKMDDIIGVIAGTPVDTKMGVDFLKAKGLNTLAFPLSPSPKEQSRLQLLSRSELYNIVMNKIAEAKNKDISKIFVYCNSLSATIDMKSIAKEEKIKIITPFNVYENIANKYSNIFIMAANGQACKRIETILESNNVNIKLWSLSILPLVEAIEEDINPEVIFDELGLYHIFEFAKINNLEAILLGCTHFPYMEETFKRNIDIPIINPAEGMYSELAKILLN